MPTRTFTGAVAWALALCLSPTGGHAEPDAAPPDVPLVLTPDDAVSLAVSLSPTIQEAQAEVASASGRLQQNRGLAFNPSLGVAYDLGGARTSLSVQQPIALRGGAPSQRTAARAQVRAAEARVLRAEYTVAATARLSYAQARVAVERRKIAQEAVSLSDRLTRAVAAKLEVGEASELDLRLAHLSQAQAATWLLEASASEALSLRELAALTQLNVQAEQLLGGILSVANWSLSDVGTDTRSDVRAAVAEVETAQAELHLAQGQALPPISVGLFFEEEQGQSWMGPTLSVTLPTFHRNQQARGGAAGTVWASEAALGATSALAHTEMQTSATWLKTAEEAMGAVQADLVKEAHEALESIALGYDAGELDLSTALILQSQVLQGLGADLTLKGQIVAARIDWALAHELDALLGGTQP